MDTKTNILRHFDAFSGYGGFTLACENLGIETVGFSEIDIYANAVLKARFPEVKNYGDINDIRIEDLPNFDILTGGFPCQDLSVAGGRKGLSARRSGLFFRWHQILKERAPSYFILENVTGLLSSNRGWDFARLLIEVASAGYDVQWGIVNAKWFVPQNRERVFITGHLRGIPRRQVFPIRGNERKIQQVGRNISFCLDANYFKGPSPMGHQSKRRQLILDRVALTERRTKEAREIRRKKMKEEGRDWSPRRGKELVPRKNGLGNCLTTGQTKEHLLLERGNPEFRIRKLTPKECERLMNLPDEWTRYGVMDGEEKEISDTQRYRMAGNGVVPAVVEEILKRLLGFE
jgi:DNA (cytosine-5)-methyltransferase 1